MFSEFFIKRPILSLVFSAFFIIAGIICIKILPIEQFPEIAPPEITITSYYTGANAKVVESTVTRLLEEEINGLEGLRYFTSSSSNTGTSMITITLEPNVNADDAVVKVQNRIKRAEARLPEEVRRNGIVVEKSSSAMVCIVPFFSDGRYDRVFISNYVDRYVKDIIKRVDGVGNVEIFGERTYSMRIWLKPDQLVKYKLSPSQIIAALREQNVQVAAGQVGQPPLDTDQKFQLSVRVLSRLKEPSEFENIVVKSGNGGTLIKIKDIARVELGSEDYSTILRYNGNENIVGMAIDQLPRANALEVSKKIRAALKELEKDFPDGLKYAVAIDTTSFIKFSIDEVVETLVIAIILVVLVIYAFIQSLRSSFIPSITIPVSLIGTFIFIKAFDFSINTLTLFGITLATGMVVDDAIVVLENISRFIEEKGMSPYKASIEGMKEIFGAVVATSLVLIVLFIPAIFAYGSVGRLYQQFAATIIFSIAISAINALTLSPALSALILKRKEHMKKNAFFDAFNSALDKLKNVLKRALFWSFRHGLSVFLFFVVCILGIFIINRFIPSSFVPEEDQGYFMVVVQAPEGSSTSHTKAVLDKAEAIIRKDPAVQDLFSVIGFSYMGSGANKGMLFPALKPFDERKDKNLSAEATIARLTPQLMMIPGAQMIPFAPPPIRGLGRFGGFEYQLKAMDGNIDHSKFALYSLKLMMAANQQPELTNVFTSYSANDPQLIVSLNKEKAKSMGIDLSELFLTLQSYLGSFYVNDFEFSNKVYKVYIQADGQYRSNPKNIEELYVKSNNGDMIPIKTFVTVKEDVSPQTITHFNSFLSATFNGSAKPGQSIQSAMQAMERISSKILPKGLSFEWSGLSKEQLEGKGQMTVLFLLGAFCVFLILAAQYESFVTPLVIMLAVPLAMFGGLAAQFLRGQESDVYCQIGLLMLVGCASKNSILVVEYADQLRKSGIGIARAVIKASLIRFRPILMTALSTVLGIVPLTLASGVGSMSRRSLGTTVTGGMLFSTVLSLIVVPVMYLFIISNYERLKKKFIKQKAIVE